MGFSSSSYALNSAGAARAWGYNSSGQLGDNTTTSRVVPALVVGSHSFVEISGGDSHSLARKSNGEVWAWGNNVYGQLGDNTSGNSKSSPVLVVGSHSFVEISGGSSYSLARKANGEVWAWGSNGYGQLGVGTTSESRSSPVLVVGSHSFVEISGGVYHSLARKSNGEVWAWGNNVYGQLGDNTTTGRLSPVLVVGSHSFVEISNGSYFSTARKANGEVWTWGDNNVGELGNNTTTDRSSPVLVVGSHSFVEISGGGTLSGNHVLARKANGEVWTWGYNGAGQLGDNTTTNRSSPVLVVGSHSFVEISGGAYHSLARKSDGQIWAWGHNNYGQLGDYSTTSKSSPVLVVGFDVNLHTLRLVKVLYYRTGATSIACEAAEWQEYTGPFTSLGYVQTRLKY